MAVKLQNENFKSSSELISDGGSASQLLNDTKIYTTANGLNKTLYQAVVDGDLAGGGGGTTGLETVAQVKAVDFADLTGFLQGKNSIVDGSALPGGTHAGTFSLDTVTPMFDTQHFKYVGAGTNANDYDFAPAISVAPGFRGKTVKFFVTAKSFTGADNVMKWAVRDAVNNNMLTSSDFYIKASTTPKKYEIIFDIPSTCSSILIGHVVTTTHAGTLLWDYAEISDFAFVMANVNQECSFSAKLSATQNISSTASTKINFNTETYDTRGAYDNATNYRFTVPAGCAGSYEFSARAQFGNVSAGTYVLLQLKKNGVVIMQDENDAPTSTYLTLSIAMNDRAVVGDYYEVFAQSGDSSYIATSNAWFTGALVGSVVESVITPASNTLVYAARITNTGTPTVATQGPEDFISSITDNGTGKFTINYVAGFFSVAPTVAVEVEHTSITNDYSTHVLNPSTTSAQIYTNIAAGAAIDRNVTITVIRQGADAKNASRALVATPVDRVCIIEDQKSSGTAGGTATSGSFQTRTLNTLKGDSSFVALSSNQFTMPAGSYIIDWSAPVYSVDGHISRLANITDSIYEYGQTQYANQASAGGNASAGSAIISITSQKTFEIQHRVLTTQSINGFGVSPSFGVTQVYTKVKIKKIK